MVVTVVRLMDAHAHAMSGNPLRVLLAATPGWSCDTMAGTKFEGRGACRECVHQRCRCDGGKVAHTCLPHTRTSHPVALGPVHPPPNSMPSSKHHDAAARARAGHVNATTVTLDRPDTQVKGPNGDVFTL
jgi:hypothetical protein